MPSSRLKPFGMLVGEWNTVGAHPLIPGTILHGRVTFEWIEDGAFLLMHSEVEEPSIPSGTAVFGGDDSTETVSMLYFDERGVSRIYETTLEDNVWKFWRNAPGFSQRATGTFTDNNTIQVSGEYSKDDLNWVGDLSQTYTRVQ